MDKKLLQIVKDLISWKSEGGYWDFKLEWYKNNADLLHDIICMANNLEEKDGYLILGVEDITKNIVGIKKDDKNRKNTQKIVDFLKDKKFAGGIRPVVYVETLILDDKEVDVIVIKQTSNTPYYLNENYYNVYRNQIYTRVQDTNTPNTSSADINHVEYLWKKRFGIGKSVMERLHIALDDWENWGIYSNSNFGPSEFIVGGDWGNNNYIFHKYFPEFRIELNKNGYHEWHGRETLRCFYMNQTAGHYETKVYFNNTEIYSFNMAQVDEYRKYIVLPYTRAFKNEKRREEKGVRFGSSPDNLVKFYYICKDSVEGKVLRITGRGNYETESRGSASEKYWLLIFEDDRELKEYLQFAEKKHDLYRIGLKGVEHYQGLEEDYAHFPISDIHNSYRVYVQFLIDHKGKSKDNFTNYFHMYELLKNEN